MQQSIVLKQLNGSRKISGSLLRYQCNYQLSKSMVHEIKFGDIAAM